MIHMRALAACHQEDEVPDVFELHAIEVRHVMALVRAVEPSRFSFVAADDDEDLET